MVVTPPEPYGLEIDLPSNGNTTNYLRIAEVLGTTSRRLDEEGCEPEVRDLLGGRGASPLDFREMGDADRIMCCPVAYAIARHAGYDPAAIFLLERLSCLVEVVHPHWSDRLTAYSGGEKKGHTYIRLRAPMARGVIWYGVPEITTATRIRINTEMAGMPSTLLIGLHERLMGSPLSDLISHPLTDPLGLKITSVVEADEDVLAVSLDPTPGFVGLDEAVGRWEDRAAGV